jgi:hypothetical protein
MSYDMSLCLSVPHAQRCARAFSVVHGHKVGARDLPRIRALDEQPFSFENPNKIGTLALLAR